MTQPFASLAALSRDLEAGRTGSARIVTDCLERIGRLNPALHALVEVYHDDALRAARAADDLRAAGHVLGPLHGLPIVLKDLFDWEGHLCEFGSLALKGRRSMQTAHAVQRLLAAGMIPLGRTEMAEFAFGGWGTNALCGTPRNPFDAGAHRAPGGSSSGSGVAVAAGLCPAALGSDTGGSVRIPAALMGIVGLKTTYGRISLHGCLSLSQSLDTVGPMTRCVEDAALLYEALAGPDPRDRATLARPPVEPGAWRDLRVAGRRVAVLAPDSFPGPVSADVAAAYGRARDVLRDLGLVLDEVELPFDLREMAELNGRLITAECYATHRAYIHDDTVPISDTMRARILRGADISAADYIAVRQAQADWAARYGDFMSGFDALLIPGAPFAAPRLDALDEADVSLALFTRPANFLATCALALPAGTDAQGLPLGIQLMGRPFDEQTLLALGHAFEAATGPQKSPDPAGLAPPG